MDKKFIKLIRCHIKALCGKCKNESSRDSVMLAHKCDCSLTLHKRFTPDQPLCDVHIKMNDFKVSLKMLALFVISALCAFAAARAARRLCFNMKWKRRF